MIYCIGDSFTAGDELPGWPDNFDCVNNPYPTHPLAWPSLLGKKLDHPIKNLGRGGCGNTRIVKRAIDVVDEKPEIVIISWSDIKRIEMADDLCVFDYWQGRNTLRMKLGGVREDLVKWVTVHQNNKDIDKWYYAAWLRQIILLQAYFTANNQRYIMLSSSPYHPYFKFSTEVETLFNKVDSTHFLGWPKDSMIEWAYGKPKGPQGHFLEEGHELVAGKIYEHIRRLGWVS